MGICFPGLRGVILIILITFPTAIVCQNGNWNGYQYQNRNGYQYHSLTPFNNQGKHDLVSESSVRRAYNSQMRRTKWQDSNSKPHWQTPMYNPKWQDPYSKPQWQITKTHNMKPFSKPFKNVNRWNTPKPWQGKWKSTWQNPPLFRKYTHSPRNTSPGSWPEYIPPLSIIKPSMDDPHALYGSSI